MLIAAIMSAALSIVRTASVSLLLSRCGFELALMTLCVVPYSFPHCCLNVLYLACYPKGPYESVALPG